MAIPLNTRTLEETRVRKSGRNKLNWQYLFGIYFLCASFAFLVNYTMPLVQKAIKSPKLLLEMEGFCC